MLHIYGDFTIAGEGLQNLGLWLVFKAFDQWKNLIMSHLVWHKAVFCAVWFDGQRHELSRLVQQVRDTEDLF